MKYYNIKIADSDGYVVGVKSGSVPKLEIVVGNLESTLFAFQDDGYVFEAKGERDKFWLRIYSNNTLDMIKSQRDGFFIEEINKERVRDL